MKTFKIISDEELKSISGSIGNILIPIEICAAKQAWEHSDQIYKGYKHGISKY